MKPYLISDELWAGLLALPGHWGWTHYDTDADVFYISFRKPQQANDSILEDDDELVSVTI